MYLLCPLINNKYKWKVGELLSIELIYKETIVTLDSHLKLLKAIAEQT